MDRDNLGVFLNSRKLLKRGVELGTHRGQFAVSILRRWRGERLYCVDHWEPYDDSDPASCISDREEDFHAARSILAKFPEAVLVRKESLQAANDFNDLSLDFVYIDACHQYRAVKRDLEIWWPKIKPGGLLMGHDIICPGEPEGGWGKMIQRAVFEFADQIERTVYLIPETLSWPWSYYMER